METKVVKKCLEFLDELKKEYPDLMPNISLYLLPKQVISELAKENPHMLKSEFEEKGDKVYRTVRFEGSLRSDLYVSGIMSVENIDQEVAS